MLVSYNWLQDYLGSDIPSPAELAELLTFHSFEIEGVTESEDDVVIDVDILPNRSSDCLSHRGIAREIATILGKPLKFDPLATKPVIDPTNAISLDNQRTDVCPRFTAQLLTGVTVSESPDWLQKRLRALGQRPINNVVDATNYVMYALGQPLHAYDGSKFPKVGDAWQFRVRTANQEEKIQLLGEGADGGQREIELSGTELLIVDASSDTPIGLAGVKGGSFAGVDGSTTTVIIEAAHFDSLLTRQTARAQKIVIDASKRFENEPARELPVYAQAMIADLLAEIAGAKSEGCLDEYAQPHINPTVAVPVRQVSGLLGLSLSIDQMVGYLERAGIVVDVQDDVLHCTGPFERTDLTIPEDFIEEIGRIHGYKHVEAVVPEVVPMQEYNSLHYYSERVRAILLSAGFSEVITSSFRKKDEVRLLNALASDKGYLRSQLQKNIQEALDKNAPHTDLIGTTDTRIFEFGTVFAQAEKGVSEHMALALGVRSKPSGYSGKEDAVLREIQVEIEKELGVKIDWVENKGVSECNFSLYLKDLPAPSSYDPVEVKKAITYKPFFTYPAITRDIALWVADGVKVDTVKETLLTALQERSSVLLRWADKSVSTATSSDNQAPIFLMRFDLFDEFSKDARTSYAFRLVFQSSEKTLTDEEMQEVTDVLYRAIHEAGWEAR